MIDKLNRILKQELEIAEKLALDRVKKIGRVLIEAQTELEKIRRQREVLVNQEKQKGDK
jgi:hypothetical protein